MIVPLLVVAVLGAGGVQQPQAPAGADRAPKTDKADKADKGDKAAKKSKKKSRKASDTPAPDADEEPDADPVEPGPGVGFVWKQHPSLRFGENFRLDFQAKLQEDFHQAYPNAPGLSCPGEALPRPCAFQLHRNRIGIKGNITRHIDYEVERELTEQELTDKDLLLGYTPKSQWKDVYLNLKVIKKVQLQVGKFKVPFGLDELTGVSHNDFIYRSLGANYLDPARDVGVMAHAHVLKRSLFYNVGVFAHDGDNARSKKIQGGGTTFAARVSGVPFRRTGHAALNQITVGSAYSISGLSDDPYLPNGIRGRTVLTQDTFFSSVYVKGHRRRWEADADFTAGRGSLRGEFTQLTDDRLEQGLGNEDLPAARARSWYVSGTWILTGERKKRPLRADADFLQGGTGAIELASRYERLWFDSAAGDSTDPASSTPRSANILANGDKALTLGVNWVLNRFLKLQFNAVREQVEDPQRSPIANGGAFWSRMMRLQIVL